MNKTRLEAFSDGVFAIVITLLILNVRVPDGHTLTFQSLQPLVPALATFVRSFIMVGVYWIAHHHMLHFIKQVNRRLLWLNLLVLLCVVFIPFPASLLGTGFNNSLAVRLYGLSCSHILRRSQVRKDGKAVSPTVQSGRLLFRHPLQKEIYVKVFWTNGYVLGSKVSYV